METPSYPMRVKFPPRTPKEKATSARKRTVRLAEPSPTAFSYTLQSACRLSGLSEGTIKRQIREGVLRSFKVGTRRLIDGAALRAFLGVVPQPQK